MKKLITLFTVILLVLSMVIGVPGCQEAPTPEPAPAPSPAPAPAPSPAPAPTPSPAPAPTPPPAPTLVPAEFEIISMNIKPMEAVAGETVSITAVIENIGGSEGTYAAMLTMDGILIEAKEVAIAPGSSKIVTFSLVEEIPGTYEIAIGNLTSTLTVEEGEEGLVAKEFDLKYDDGTTDWSQAIGGPGRGHIVQFSPPYTPFAITTVKIFGKLYGTGYENLMFDVQIWDSEQKEIHSASYPHTEFSLQPTWVEIDISDVTVSGDFYIHVFTNSPKEGGISIHSDSSIVNEHSEVTQNWEIVDWYLSSPKEEANWMIRVKGTAMLPATTVPETTPEEVETAKIEITFDPNPVPCIDGYWKWRVILTEVNGIGVKLDSLIYDRYGVNQTMPADRKVYDSAWFEQWVPSAYLSTYDIQSAGFGFPCQEITHAVITVMGTDDNGHKITAEARVDFQNHYKR